VDWVIELLRTRGRLTYRVLKREFELDDEQLEDLKEELIEGQRVAVDENGKVLVWTGDQEGASTPSSSPSESQTPASYTPPHLAERILAEQSAIQGSKQTANRGVDPSMLWGRPLRCRREKSPSQKGDRSHAGQVPRLPRYRKA